LTASAVSVRLGTELPQIVHEPPDIASRDAGDDAIALANNYMFDAPACLAPSQELRLRNGMATRSDGKWAASRVGDFGGRQGAGKTDTILARILAGVLLLDEQLIIYTAHEYTTANEIFLRLMTLFDNWDDLGRELARSPKRAHGDQGFELHGGRRILIKTRTGKSGRGFAKADLLVYDEAQHLQPEHVAGSGPAKLAHPNPQSWYAGSGGLTSSVVAWQMRRQAILGTGGRLSYTEHTAQSVSIMDGRVVLTDPDPEDREAWAHANPGLGRWVSEEGMDDMRAELAELFPREGLCVWEPEPGEAGDAGPISLARWAELVDAGSSIAGEVSTAIDVSPDLKWASVVSAGLRSDGHIHVEVGRRQPGTEWVVPFARANPKHGPYRVAGSGPAGFLLPLLAEADVDVVNVPAGEVTQACARLIAAVDGGTIHHLGSNEIAAALSNATIANRGDAQAWSRVKSSGDISALVAATIAVGGVTADESDPQIFF
jgi:hypothetical protein